MHPTPILDDFETAYRARVEENRPMLALMATIITLTDFGEQAVPLERLCTELDWSREETLAHISRWAQGVVRIEKNLVQFDVSSPATGRPARYRIRRGERVIHAGGGGCALDLFAVVLWTGKPMQVEATCAATGRLIRVDLAPGTVTRVEPASAVISLVNPRGPRFKPFRNNQEASELICSQQNLYASREVAADWLARNPGGRLLPVREFPAWTQRIFA
jgi:hypothetical protein